MLVHLKHACFTEMPSLFIQKTSMVILAPVGLD